MLDTLLNGNTFVKYAVASFVVFAPLYFMSSYGVDWANQVALLVFVAVLIYFVGQQHMDFNGIAHPNKAQ